MELFFLMELKGGQVRKIIALTWMREVVYLLRELPGRCCPLAVRVPQLLSVGSAIVIRILLTQGPGPFLKPFWK